MSVPSIGDNLASIRRPLMTQMQLAERSGVSIETIRKLEQNERQDARMQTLRKLARALEVPTTALLAGSAAKSAARRESESDALALMELRQVLTPVPGAPPAGLARDAPDPTVASVRAAMHRVDSAYTNDDYASVLDRLPPLLTEARALVDGTTGSDHAAGLGLLAHSYRLAGRTLVQFRAHDLAYQALTASLDVSSRAGDPLRDAAIISTISWLLMRQGRFAEAEQAALGSADTIEPRFAREVDAAQLAVWGWLMLMASAAAARDARDDDANALLDAAAAAAVRIGERDPGRHLETGGFCLAKIEMQRVETAVVTADPDRALTLASTVPAADRANPACRHRHQLDVAWAYAQDGQYTRATDVLVGIQRVAPAWLRQQTYARETVETIAAGRRRAMSAKLSQLADLVGATL